MPQTLADPPIRVRFAAMAVQSRFLVGIDLGTTHTVVAYADTKGLKAGEAPAIQTFSVEQLVSAGEVAERSVLPSARFHPLADTLDEGARALPWGTTEWNGDDGARAEFGIVGTLANTLGTATPGRMVTSAKSWLSHPAVDRTAAILPWGASDEVLKVSPVDASASFLAHVRAAWDHRHPNNPLSTQEVVLTVPASFDEGARALTLQAAKKAGFRVRLVEEPQAAFYRWLDAKRDDLEASLGSTRLALVVDVGGGTTDLTLLKVELRESGPRITRIAVGEHLMLGGDNMDLALAKGAEKDIGRGKALSAARFAQLVHECRHAKELLLGADAPEKAVVTVLGSGSKLIGGTQRSEIDRAAVEALALDGFFPEVALTEEPQNRRGGIVEFGLPYVSDAAVTRHVAAFLRRHERLAAEALGVSDERGDGSKGIAVPDAVLFNGGVFHSASLRDRMRSVLSGWRGDEVALLENEAPDLAVAEGAVAYALARRGMGVRIGGGSARSYFLVVDRKGDEPSGVCVLPRGSEEGEEVELKERTFSLKLGRPVRFHLVSSTADVEHVSPGDLVQVDDGDRYTDLPPIAAVLTATGDKEQDEVPVTLRAALTEIGTLQMSCIEANVESPRRWKMEQQLRGAGDKALAAQKVGQLHPRFAEATERVKRIYGKSKSKVEVKPAEVKRTRAELEKILGTRDTWDTPLLRELFGELLAGGKRRRRTADHERVWFHLVGYTLRPGFGYPLDSWRVKQMSSILDQGVQFSPDAQNWSEFWTMWRRLAGGLEEKQQNKIMEMISFYLQPPTKKPRKRPSGPKMLGVDDMVRLAGALERVDVERKARVGGWLVERLDKHNENPQSWWAVGRIGARVPFYGSAHQVVPAHIASQWLEKALTFDFADTPEAAFAATLLSRVSGDRQRDLEEHVRTHVAEKLEAAGASESWRKMVLEIVHLDEADERRIFGDSMPPGLRLID